ncbi:N-acetylmuramoyl-L-alanine amidase [Siminovitchia sediminis]|uniref:N-acetylmuramoyl-L-alanine amidase n=1 Tax=Siminovitchia sediminis TaxID=1274353 RepID=A0ABW4KIG9_9BACI
MVAIKRQLVSQNVIEQRSYGYGNPCNYITIHQTGNTNRGADAQAHANIQTKLNPRTASWHYQVDDHEIIQSFPDTVMCWHASDGQGPGNTQSIAIEICVNRDGNYEKAMRNAADLTKHLMRKHNLGIDKIKQHHDWSLKDCPDQLREGYKGIAWDDFLRMVENEVPTDPPEIESSPQKGTYSGNSIVDYLKSINMDSSFANRSKLAAQYGIENYRGTAEQNLELLNRMRTVSNSNKPSQSYTGHSIVDYLKSIGVDASFANRERLAKQYGITNYKGTASQNLDLLNKIRSNSLSTPAKPKGGYGDWIHC